MHPEIGCLLGCLLCVGKKIFAVAPTAIANIFLSAAFRVLAYLPPCFLVVDNSFSSALFVAPVVGGQLRVFAS